MQYTTRRDFIAATSLAMAGTVLAARSLKASVLTADSYLENRISGDDMRALVTYAVDAARQAGASYADIRIAERNELEAEIKRVVLRSQLTYGVRAMINGKWGFAYGRGAIKDDVVRCAQEAVASARVSSQLFGAANSDDENWIPAPVVTGEWSTPVQVDPFTVPIQQHSELQDAMKITVARVPKAGLGLVGITSWIREKRVFGATTGSLVTQNLHRVQPWFNLIGGFGRAGVAVSVPINRWLSMGYETLLDPNLMDQLKSAAEEAIQWARLPMRALPVGRYPVVMDGYSTGAVLGNLLGPALEMDRVLGSETEASGTSKLTIDMLGSAIAGPLLNVSGNRALPSVTAVKWDDEGNTPMEHMVIKDGALIDYHTSGGTVSALKQWYSTHNKPLQSNGCAVATTADSAVTVRTPHLYMQAGQSGTSVEDLCKEMKRGVLIVNNNYVPGDQQLTSGSVSPWSFLFEVSQGKVIGRLKDTGLQFNTLPLFKTLTALGDETTVRHQNVRTDKGMPWITDRSGATAPAALFKEINAISSRY